MNILSSLKSILKLATVASTALITTSLTNCGGGSAGGDDESYTLRPKTLEGVTLQLANSVTFEFVRDSSSSAAINNGDTEFGNFLYTAASDTFTANSLDNTEEEIAWPSSIGSALYTYTAINDSSGVIVVTTSVIDLKFGTNGDHSYFSKDDGNGNTSARMIVTFIDTGGFASTADIRLEDPEDPFTVLTSGAFTVDGGALSANYNIPIDDNRQSKLSPETIGGNNIIFTDDSDPTFNFTLVVGVGLSTIDYDEIGETAYLNDMGDVTVNAAPYFYNRILGTDNASLILEGTDNSGTTNLLFLSPPTTPYQTASGSYTTPNGRKGTFVFRNSGGV